MDTTVLYVLMAVISVLMIALPFGIFMGIGSMLELAADDGRLQGTFLLAALVILALAALGSFTLIQKQSCGQVKDMGQIFSNTKLAVGIQGLVLGLVWWFPWLKGLVVDLLPPDINPLVAESVGYGYWSFWATLFGIALGGSFSAICKP